MKHNQLNSIEYSIIYIIDVIAKLIFLTVLSPAFIIVILINVMWRSNAKVNDICFYRSLNNKRVDVKIVEINGKECKVLIKGSYNYKTININKLSILSL